MVNWQITATTIYCDAVDDEITILVKKDWSVQCTGYQAYREPGKDAANLEKKGRQLKRKLICEGPDCWRVAQYKDRLLAEETGKMA